ncbi:MAG: succinate dehydrogenase, cytochrome b556 subunit [Alphaproteobacteria bacterium]
MATTSESGAGDNRPLSPFLWHWRWHLSMLTSILHRIMGVALSFGMIFLAAWFVSAAMGPEAYAVFQRAAGHPIGLVVLFGFTFAAVYHTISGIRHLCWDAGIGFGREKLWPVSVLVIFSAVAVTVLIWVAAYAWRGGAL